MIAWLVLLQAALTIAVAGPATSPEYLPLHVAQAEGLFAAERLTVTLRSTRSGRRGRDAGDRPAQLAATSLDTACGSADRAARRRGSSRPHRRAAGRACSSRPAAPTPSAPGRSRRQTVAVPAPGTAEDQALGMLLARAGVACTA
jgi:ABC-type nitrate/sulfonate/bicarbonate transport system substrate-binding protein